MYYHPKIDEINYFIYLSFLSEMELFSLTNCFNFEIKWFNVINRSTRFAIIILSDSFSKSITLPVLLAAIDFLSWQKTLLALIPKYTKVKVFEICTFLKKVLTYFEQCIGYVNNNV